jgi:hypothetical protein
MFAGLSLFKKLENVVMSNNDSRVIYTAPRDCFVSIMVKQVDIISSGGFINPPFGLLYTKAIRFRHFMFPAGIGISGYLPDLVPSPYFAFLKSGENLHWQRSNQVRYLMDVYILTVAEP